MIIPINGPGGLNPLYSTSATQSNNANAADAAKKAGSQFDQLKLTQNASEESQFHRALVSRLVQEVRCANTTGDIQRIKDEVQNGTYKPDASEIASKLLLEVSEHGKDL